MLALQADSYINGRFQIGTLKEPQTCDELSRGSELLQRDESKRFICHDVYEGTTTSTAGLQFHPL